MRLIDADELYALIDGGFDLDFDEVPRTKAALLRMIAEQTVIEERKKGKWTEKEVMNIEDSRAIEEWQSCSCSECGRYHTEPYMYYFNEPNFCSWCGADMRGEQK